jgi:hypothetical protein
MTISEKIEVMNLAIAPDTADKRVLEVQLDEAEAMILAKMYPFGYPEDMALPSRYERLQIKLAVELFTQRGAEGQASHTENGVTRTWPSVNRILAQIPSCCGSVISNA